MTQEFSVLGSMQGRFSHCQLSPGYTPGNGFLLHEDATIGVCILMYKTYMIHVYVDTSAVLESGTW